MTESSAVLHWHYQNQIFFKKEMDAAMNTYLNL